MKKLYLSKKQKKDLLYRIPIFIILFLFLQLVLANVNLFKADFPSQMSSRITNLHVEGLEQNETSFLLIVDYQVYNSGPFTVFSYNQFGGNPDLLLPFSFSSSDIYLNNISIYNLMWGGALMGGVDRIKPGIHDYSTTYEICENIPYEEQNYTLPDGDYYFRIGKMNWNQIYGVNFTIAGENYTAKYEIPTEPWKSHVFKLGDPYSLIYCCVAIIILIRPIFIEYFNIKPDQLKEEKLKSESHRFYTPNKEY